HCLWGQQFLAIAVKVFQHLCRGGNLGPGELAVLVRVEQVEKLGRDSCEGSRSLKREGAILEFAIVTCEFFERRPAVAIGIERLEVESDVNIRAAEVRKANQRKRGTACFLLVNETVLVAVEIGEQRANVIAVSGLVAFLDRFAIDLDVQTDQDGPR